VSLRTLVATAVLGLSAAVLLTGCADDDGGDDSAATTRPADGGVADDETAPDDEDGDFDACTVLPRERVQEVTGSAVAGLPDRESTDAGSFCDNDLENGGEVSLHVRPKEQRAKDTFAAARTTASQSVDGLGDDAYWNAGTHTLFVLDADRTFSIGVSLPGAAARQREVAVALARVVLENLGSNELADP
jgi:hypothetical protein